MICLPNSYKKNGYYHRQIYREGDIAIYETKTPETGRVVCYEVFEIQKIPAGAINGKVYEAREATPSNSAWGILGWSVSNKDAAFKKVEYIRQREKRQISERGKLRIDFRDSPLVKNNKKTGICHL